MVYNTQNIKIEKTKTMNDTEANSHNTHTFYGTALKKAKPFQDLKPPLNFNAQNI